MNKVLIVLGLVCVAAGLLWPWLRNFPLFHLPGDIILERRGFRLFVPISTMLLLSALLSLVAWLMRH
jgi:hypothetical protein